ncbi:TPA: hypothetical protein DDZ86_01975 [Candidatus Dependentiae bacterium]|nr:MAG: hypothetical protein UW09_C0001G0244 [candidate division TM6 bacterium GW2011_GWF2_43_87]HBL98391.1 hypothetical protein [Candidatus Dependentiae bacterium]
MIKKQTQTALICTALFILPGCFWAHKKRNNPHPLVEQIRTKGKSSLQLSAQWLDESTCKKRFWGVNLIGSDIEVLRIRLINNGEERYIFRPSYCSIDRLPADEIAPLLQYDTSSRVCWLSLPAFIFCWPLIPLIIVPQGLYWHHENHKRFKWLQKNTLGPDTSFEVAAYETVEKYLFVPTDEAEYHPLSLELFDSNTKELVKHSIS